MENAISQLQINQMVRDHIRDTGILAKREIERGTFSGRVGQVHKFVPDQTGLLMKLVVFVRAKISATGANAQTLQERGLANFFSEIRFRDYSGNVRIETSGMHLHALSSAHRGRPFGAAYESDTQQGIGSNADIMRAPTVINSAASDYNVHAVFEIPIARSRGDWRGAIYSNVTSQQAELALRVNDELFVDNTATDTSKAMYKSANGDLGTLEEYEITVVQHGWEQFGKHNSLPMLPPLDTKAMYELRNTNKTDFSAGSDYQIPYSNNRLFYSTLLEYNNGGALNFGTDIDNFRLQVANSYKMLDIDPRHQYMEQRERFNGDLGGGLYFFDHSDRPIRTLEFGNISLIVRAKEKATNGEYNLFYEAIGDLERAGSATAIGAA